MIPKLIVTDVLGLPLAMVIHAANVFDGVGARDVFKNLANKYPRLRKILADGGYRGEELAEEAKRYGWELSVVLRPDESSKKFSVIPKRWIVERTFGVGGGRGIFGWGGSRWDGGHRGGLR